MNHYLPVLLGLIGFLQPCTMGANWAFVGHVQGLEKWGRMVESLKLALVRTVFLGALGSAAGYLGGYAAVSAKSLALPFLAISLVFLISRFRALPVPNVDLVKTSHLAVRQGLMVPSCLLPLTLALLLLGAFSRSPAQGLVYLSAFSIALTAPLLFVSAVNPQRALHSLTRLVTIAPLLASLSLALIAWLLYSEVIP